jgi:TolB-like protein/DNA-binding winged helix-turn-helix (wHTH) protein/Tfp pilus assembly protein PilF
MSESQYRFAEFHLDCASFELRRQGRAQKSERVSLERIPMELLILLLERQGSVVTRQEIVDRLWGKDVFVDTEHGINTAIRKVRQALKDDPDNPRFILTVSGKGYRFVTEKNGRPETLELVEGRTPRTPSGPDSSGSSLGTGDLAAPHRALIRRKTAIAIVALSLLAATPWVVLRLRLFLGTQASRSHSIQSVAVLPLINLSSEAGQDFFADGMTEELTTDLGKISALRVISRTSCMQYKGTNKPLQLIARELNVDALIEGTVTRSGNHLRITASLVQAFPERHLWAENYEAEVGDALTVQREIAQAVAREIQVKLKPRERNLLAYAKPVNPEAQDLYLRGRYIAGEKRTAESSARAIKYFQQAIEIDPNYAAAYAGLAHVYAVWIPGMGRPRDLMPKAKEFALKALALDDTLADAHSELGTIELLYYWDWSAAEAEFGKTMELDPNHAWALKWHARELVTRGRTEDAIAEAERSLTLDPSPFSWDYPIWVFVLARRTDLALERTQELLELAPNFVWAHWEMAQIDMEKGEAEQAAEESLKADELFGTEPTKLSRLKQAIARSGAQGYWRQTLENYKESAKSTYVPSVLVAEACVRVGDRQCAFEWLERGFEERDDLMINLKVQPAFDNLRSDPRFQDLIRRVGIPQ